jgi:integrase
MKRCFCLRLPRVFDAALALQANDVDFANGTIYVDESLDRLRQIGPVKNVAAYRTVVLADAEGQYAMRALRRFIKRDGLLFRSRRGGRLVENTALVQGLHPALKQLGFPKSGMHAFRRGQSMLGTYRNLVSRDSSTNGPHNVEYDGAVHRPNSVGASCRAMDSTPIGLKMEWRSVL